MGCRISATPAHGRMKVTIGSVVARCAIGGILIQWGRVKPRSIEDARPRYANQTGHRAVRRCSSVHSPSPRVRFVPAFCTRRSTPTSAHSTRTPIGFPTMRSRASLLRGCGTLPVGNGSRRTTSRSCAPRARWATGIAPRRRNPGEQRAVEPRDRGSPVPQHSHHRVPPAQGLHQAERDLAHTAHGGAVAVGSGQGDVRSVVPSASRRPSRRAHSANEVAGLPRTRCTPSLR